MKSRQISFLVTVIIGLISFGCLVAIFLAGNDIWHDLGGHNFWSGQGSSPFEWRVLTVAYWPVFIFHIIFFIAATVIMVGWKNRKK